MRETSKYRGIGMDPASPGPSKNCFLSWLQEALVTITRAKGQLNKAHKAAGTRIVDVFPLPLAATSAVGWPASM